MRLRSWLAGKALAWSWGRLTPAQRTDFLYERRHDLLHSLTPLQQRALLVDGLPSAQRLALASALVASKTPPERSYVY